MLTSKEKTWLEGLEQEWIGQVPRNVTNWDWQPFDLGKFHNMMSIVCAQFPGKGMGRSFLDAGCGIGTKMWVAEREFSMKAHGIDIVPEYVAIARTLLKVEAELADATTYPLYGSYDVVYLSRPLRDDTAEVAYERMVHSQMAPGAILVAAWAAVKPQWIVLDRGPWRGVWRKPPDGQTVPRLPLGPVPGREPADDPDVHSPTPGGWKLKRPHADYSADQRNADLTFHARIGTEHG